MTNDCYSYKLRAYLRRGRVRFLTAGFFCGAEEVAVITVGFDCSRIISATVDSGMAADITTSLSLLSSFSAFNTFLVDLSGTELIACCNNPDNNPWRICAVSGLSAFIAPRTLKVLP